MTAITIPTKEHDELRKAQRKLADIVDRGGVRKEETRQASVQSLPQGLHDASLLKVAESSFTFWDNPDDAIYDNWKEHYHVPER